MNALLCAHSTHKRHAINRGMAACRMKQPALLYVRPEARRRGVRKLNTPIYVHSGAPVTQRHPDTLAARETQQERARVWGDFSQRASYRGVVTHLHDSLHETPQNGDADSGCIGDARPVSSQCHGIDDMPTWHSLMIPCGVASDANVWDLRRTLGPSSTVMYGAEKHR